MNIIDGLQKRSIKILEILITLVAWIFMSRYIFEIFVAIVISFFDLSNSYGMVLTLDNIQASIHIVLITVAITMGVFILIYFWGKYNYKRYAHLSRRKFPIDVTKEEIEIYFDLPSPLVEEMQNHKVIILEKTIV